MKKRTLTILLSLMFILIAAFFVGCEPDSPDVPGPNNPPDNPPDDPPAPTKLIPLSAPIGLSIDGNTLTWQPVENANSYSVQIIGTNYKTTLQSNDLSCSVDRMSKDGYYNVAVKAVGDKVTYEDSPWSENAGYYYSKNSTLALNFEAVDGGYKVCGFKEGKSMSTLAIPSVVDGISVVEIGKLAFSNDKQISTVFIPATIKYLGNNSFSYAKVSTVNFLGGEVEIGENAFFNCKELKFVDVRSGSISIGKRAFMETNFEFSQSSFDKITSIGEEAFYNNVASIDEIVVPDSVISVGKRAYWGRLPKKIKIGASLTEIGEEAFGKCENLTEITVSSDNKRFAVADKCLIDKQEDKIVLAAQGATIPSTVKVIGAGAFAYRTELQSIALPKSVTRVESKAFYGCSSLSYIAMRDEVEYIGSEAFAECESLTRMVFGKNITSIPDGVLSKCSSLDSCVFLAKITSIGSNAFRDCYKLQGIEWHDTLTSIGSYAFYGCSALQNFEFPKSVVEIGVSAFAYCTSLTEITLPDNIKKIDGLFLNCTKLRRVKLGANLEVLGEMAFASCSALSEVIFNDKVMTIGRGAFSGCLSLTEISLPDSVKKIETAAFFQSNLTKIKLPKDTSSFDSSAFARLTTLQHIQTAISLSELSRLFRQSTALKTVLLKETYIEGTATPLPFAEATYYVQKGGATYINYLKALTLESNVIIYGCEFTEDDSLKSVTISEGSILNYKDGAVINAPCRMGYTFGGWVTLDDSGKIIKTYQSSEIASLPANTTVFINWIKQ